MGDGGALRDRISLGNHHGVIGTLEDQLLRFFDHDSGYRGGASRDRCESGWAIRRWQKVTGSWIR